MHQEQAILGRIHELIRLDNSEFDELYEAEIGEFESVRAGGTVQHEDVAAALVCRDAGRLDLLQQLHQGRIHATGYVDLENPAIGNLTFRV